MVGVQTLILDGSLYFVRADSCMLGYADQVSGLSHMKPMGFVTDMEAAVIILEGYQRRGRHLLHQPLEGSNALAGRTAQAGRWPDKLDDVIAEIIQLETTIDDQRAEHTAYATRSRE